MLLVEDDPELSVAVAELLVLFCDVLAVNSAWEALDALSRSVPHAVVADFDLPCIRGDALLDIVAREHPKVRRVLHTAADVTAADLCGPGVAQCILRKPAPLAELLRAIGVH